MHIIAFEKRVIPCLQILALAIVATMATTAAAKDSAQQPAEIAEKSSSPLNNQPRQPLGPPPCDGADYQQPGLHLGRPEDTQKDGWREAQRSCEHRPYSP